MGIPDYLTCRLRNLHAGQEATEPDMEQWTGSELGKEYVKAVYYHPPYLTYMQSTSCKMLGWINHKLESRLLGERSNSLRCADDATLIAESKEELKSLLMRVKESEAGLKLKIKKTEITASSLITLC